MIDGIIPQLFAVLERIATGVEQNNELLKALADKGSVESALPTRKRIERAIKE